MERFIRFGLVAGVVGGVLLALGRPASEVLLYAVAPGLVTAALVLFLGYYRRTSQRQMPAH